MNVGTVIVPNKCSPWQYFLSGKACSHLNDVSRICPRSLSLPLFLTLASSTPFLAHNNAQRNRSNTPISTLTLHPTLPLPPSSSLSFPSPPPFNTHIHALSYQMSPSAVRIRSRSAFRRFSQPHPPRIRRAHPQQLDHTGRGPLSPLPSPPWGDTRTALELIFVSHLHFYLFFIYFYLLMNSCVIFLDKERRICKRRGRKIDRQTVSTTSKINFYILSSPFFFSSHSPPYTFSPPSPSLLLSTL